MTIHSYLAFAEGVLAGAGLFAALLVPVSELRAGELKALTNCS
ncbi:MAG: hypothetical protein ACK6B2_18875 [Planctomycetota bacterium]|jgi:hypothetical protein